MPDALIESIVSMPVLNPGTRGCSRSFCFMGVTDRVEGHRLIDWKGVADTHRFLVQQRIGYQGELYALALAHRGITIHEIEYRLVTRPTIRFCKGQDDWDRDKYEDRCLNKWLLKEPERLLTHNYPIALNKLEQARWFLWECSKRILDSRRYERWIPNVKACFAYERECEYVQLCESVQGGGDWKWAAEDAYDVRKSSHPELQGADADSVLEVLTHSSVSDLTLCEMYYFWKHEERYKRRSTVDGEAQWIGSAMHRGLQAYAGGGEEVAFGAIDRWAEANPILGEAAGRKQDQDIAKARAMVRAACLKWPMEAT